MQDLNVRWAGAVASGQPINPVQAEMPPLVAAMLAELLRDPAFTETAKEHPRAYAGLLELGRQIDSALYQDSIQNAVHYDNPPGPTAREYLREIRKGIDRVPTNDHTGLHRAMEEITSPTPAVKINSERVSEVPARFRTGRVRMPRDAYGFRLGSGGQAND